MFEGESLTYVNRYDGVMHDEWNLTTGPILGLRKTIRAHYLKEQKYRCAYCRMEKKEDHGLTWDVEHVIAKSTHPRFLYEPLNLAMVCKECNISKSNQNVLSKSLSPKSFPSHSNEYKIVHPHFDRYSDHFEVIIVGGRITHRPRNDHKAKETFIMCDLVRFSYAFCEWDSFDHAIVEEFDRYVRRCPDTARPNQVADFMKTLTFTINADF